MGRNWFELVERGLEVAERAECLGPIGVGAVIWEALPQTTRERVLGHVCEDCGEPSSRCECCAVCGFTPCACDARFAGERVTIDVEGEAI